MVDYCGPMDAGRLKRTVSPEGTPQCPIDVRILRLPGLYEQWSRSRSSLEALEFACSEVLTTTTFLALVEHAWQNYGRTAAWHALVCQILDSWSSVALQCLLPKL